MSTSLSLEADRDLLSGLLKDWAGRKADKRSTCVAFVCDWAMRRGRPDVEGTIRKAAKSIGRIEEAWRDVEIAEAIADQVAASRGMKRVGDVASGDIATVFAGGLVYFGVVVAPPFIAVRSKDGITLLRASPTAIYRMV